MMIIGQISIQSLTTHCDFFQFTLTLLAKVFVWNKSGLKQNVTETSLLFYIDIGHFYTTYESYVLRWLYSTPGPCPK